MADGLMELLRLDIICPKCGQKNKELVKGLIETNEFNCFSCGNRANISGDSETQNRLAALKDFLAHSYVPK